jgi:hypothetical protein
MSTLGVISGTTTDDCLFMVGPSGAARLLLSLRTVCRVVDGLSKQKDRPKADGRAHARTTYRLGDFRILDLLVATPSSCPNRNRTLLQQGWFDGERIQNR